MCEMNKVEEKDDDEEKQEEWEEEKGNIFYFLLYESKCRYSVRTETAYIACNDGCLCVFIIIR